MAFTLMLQRSKTFLVLFFVATFTGCGTGDQPSGNSDIPDKIAYNTHVRPILSDKCFTCHGPDKNKREANLRLDNEQDAWAELSESKGKHAIVPGKPAKSELISRINDDDPEQGMPPAASNLALTNAEKDILKRWIKQGATYEPLWSLIKPISTPPPVNNTNWIQNEIDQFVFDNMQRAGLQPAQPATKETLIRRASFDLTGLPPTLSQIDAFLADDGPDAYEQVIDDYLASPGYGERMASWWLDIARYADSDGYLDDKHRDFTPWRDWVISAFNKNQPYDDFVTWQLAGDLIPDATQEQILATAFNRLHKKNSEAGIVFEEFRSEYVADRTNTFGKAFLGLTAECARCHDHKYDPISQKEYYQLYGFFNNTNEIGHAVYGPDQTPGPALLLKTPLQASRIDSLENIIRRLEQQLPGINTEAEHAFTSTATQSVTLQAIGRQVNKGLVAHYPFDQLSAKNNNKATSPNLKNRSTPATLTAPVKTKGIKGDALLINNYNGGRLGEKVGWYDRTDPFSVDVWIYPDTTYEEAMIFTHSESWRLGLRGYNLQLEDNNLVFRIAHSYPQNAIQVETTEQVPVKEWTHITLTYDGSSKAAGAKIYVNGALADQRIQYDNLYKGITFTPDIHTYGFDGIQIGQRVKFTPFKNGKVDEFKVFNTALTPLEVQYIHEPELAAKTLHDSQVNDSDTQATQYLKAYFLAHHHPPAHELNRRLKAVREELNAALNDVQEIMVMGDLAEPRKTFVLDRGLYSAPAEEVTPDTPAAILSFPEDKPKNRLGLAAWLFDENNPLTSRVIVNHLWQMHFGKGLVSTADDFGNQGAQPTHAALLDWLAVHFRESGWDLKALHKTIMRSATYQQSSRLTEDTIESDPENKLLARGPSFRLTAEMIRDNALAISGLITPKTGGPSAYPYQPAGLWDELTTKHWRYPYLQEPGEGLYRRSLYTIWKRTAPPPSMLIFDAPDRSTCTIKRENTSTPLQALALLNDPQYIEASRVLAEKLLTSNISTPALLKNLFRIVTSRIPTQDELTLLEDFYAAEIKTFSSNAEQTLNYLSTGTLPRNEALPPANTAALTVVANALLNTDEGYMRR
ncbi:MAG: DUF1553 domain-containing protein [Rhodothermales bacterium]